MANVVVINGGFSAGFSSGFDVYRLDQTNFDRLNTSTVLHNNSVQSSVVITSEKILTLSIIDGDTSFISSGNNITKIQTNTITKNNTVIGIANHSATKILTTTDISAVGVVTSSNISTTKINTLSDLTGTTTVTNANVTSTKIVSNTSFKSIIVSTNTLQSTSKILTFTDVSNVNISASANVNSSKINGYTEYGLNTANSAVSISVTKIISTNRYSNNSIVTSSVVTSAKLISYSTVDSVVINASANSSANIDTTSSIRNVTVSSAVTHTQNKILSNTIISGETATISFAAVVTRLVTSTVIKSNTASTTYTYLQSSIDTNTVYHNNTVSVENISSVLKVLSNTSIKTVSVNTTVNTSANIDTISIIKPTIINGYANINASKIITSSVIDNNSINVDFTINAIKVLTTVNLKSVSVITGQSGQVNKLVSYSEIKPVSVATNANVIVTKYTSPIIVKPVNLQVTSLYSDTKLETSTIIDNINISSSSVISQVKALTITDIKQSDVVVDFSIQNSKLFTNSIVKYFNISAHANVNIDNIELNTNYYNNNVSVSFESNIDRIDTSIFVIQPEVNTTVDITSNKILTISEEKTNSAIGGYSTSVQVNSIDTYSTSYPVIVIASALAIIGKINSYSTNKPRTHASVGIIASSVTYIRPVIVEVSDDIIIEQTKIITESSVLYNPYIISDNNISVKKLYSEGYLFNNNTNISDIDVLDLPWLNCGIAEENPYFSVWSDCKQSERNFFDKTATELINLHGVDCVYYHSDYNTNNNKLFGEDNDYMYSRKFPIKAMFELPVDQRRATLAGLEVDDKVEIKITIDHFKAASTFDYKTEEYYVYESVIPKQSDLIKFEYNGVYYEVLSSKKSFDNFLQGTHVWRLMVTPYVQNKQSVSTDIKQDEIRRIVSSQDIFDTTDLINSIKGDYIQEQPPTKPNSIFGKWS